MGPNKKRTTEEPEDYKVKRARNNEVIRRNSQLTLINSS